MNTDYWITILPHINQTTRNSLINYHGIYPTIDDQTLGFILGLYDEKKLAGFGLDTTMNDNVMPHILPYLRYLDIMIFFPHHEGETLKYYLQRVAEYHDQCGPEIRFLFRQLMGSKILQAYVRRAHGSIVDAMRLPIDTFQDTLLCFSQHLYPPEVDFHFSRYPYTLDPCACLMDGHGIKHPHKIGAGELRLRIQQWRSTDLGPTMFILTRIDPSRVANRDQELIDGRSIDDISLYVAWGNKHSHYILAISEVEDMVLRFSKVIAPNGQEIPSQLFNCYTTQVFSPIVSNLLNACKISISRRFFFMLRDLAAALRGWDGQGEYNLLQLNMGETAYAQELLLVCSLRQRKGHRGWKLPTYNWIGPTTTTLGMELEGLQQGNCRLHTSSLFLASIHHYYPQALEMYDRSELESLRMTSDVDLQQWLALEAHQNANNEED